MNQHEMFYLARYAYNTMAPAIDDLKKVETTANLGIDLTFGKYGLTQPDYVNIAVHWEREGMPLFDVALTSTSQVDNSAEKLRKFTAKLRADICKGCDRHIDDEDYGRDSDCDVCFRDPTPLTREAVTAPAAPAPDTRDKHSRSL